MAHRQRIVEGLQLSEPYWSDVNYRLARYAPRPAPSMAERLLAGHSQEFSGLSITQSGTNGVAQLTGFARSSTRPHRASSNRRHRQPCRNAVVPRDERRKHHAHRCGQRDDIHTGTLSQPASGTGVRCNVSNTGSEFG